MAPTATAMLTAIRKDRIARRVCNVPTSPLTVRSRWTAIIGVIRLAAVNSNACPRVSPVEKFAAMLASRHDAT